MPTAAVLTRRRVLVAVGATIAAGRAHADAPAQPLSRIHLSGEHGRRVMDAHANTFHLHNQRKGSPLDRALKDLWNKVFDATDGALMVTVLANDANLELDDAEAVFNVAAGHFGFASVAAPILDALVPDVALQSLPFAYKDVAEVLKLSDSLAFARLMEKGMSPAGLAFLSGGTFSNGFRVIASRESKPIRRLDDLRGLKIRIPPSKDICKLFQTFGAAPVPLPISGMLAAFVSGTIDAEENPSAIIKEFDLQSQTHWISLTRHMWTGFNTLANKDFWDSLPAKVRETALDLLPSIRARQVVEQEALNAKVQSDLVSSGMQVIDVAVGDAHSRVKPVYDFMLDHFSKEARALAEPYLKS